MATDRHPFHGAASSFPLTRSSVFDDVRSEEANVRRVGYEVLIRTYWKPVYKYVRLKWKLKHEEAVDCVQEFFAHSMEGNFFARFEAGRARFRTYLRVCLDAFVMNQRQAETRLKRGGAATILSLDFAAAERELAGVEPCAAGDLDEYFRQEWMRGLFERSIAVLREHCAAAGKMTHFELFRSFDLEAPNRVAGESAPSYAELAQAHSLPVTQVTNYLAWARRELRAIVLLELRAQCASEEEFREEARELLGVDPS